MLLPSKTLAAQRRSDSCRAPSRSPNTLHREASSSQKGLGPVRRLVAGDTSPSRQRDHWLLISSGTHSGFPAPSLHPSQTFVTGPHSENVSTLSQLTVGRRCVQHRDNRLLGVGRSLRAGLVQAPPPGRILPSWNPVLPNFSDFRGLRQGRRILRSSQLWQLYL